MMRCWYCGTAESVAAPLTTDHVTPRSRGGGDDAANLVRACRGCNAAKHNMTLEEYRRAESFRCGEFPVVFFGEADLSPPVVRDVIMVASRRFWPELMKPHAESDAVERVKPWTHRNAARALLPKPPPPDVDLIARRRARTRAAHVKARREGRL